MMPWRVRRGNKLHAVRAPGLTSSRMYASTAERDRAEELRLLERAGAIQNLQEQVTVDLGIRYRADFVYLERGRIVFEDVKGIVMQRFRDVCTLWRTRGPGVLRVTKRAKRGRSFVIVREIPPAPVVLCPRCGHVGGPFKGQTGDENARVARPRRARRAQA